MEPQRVLVTGGSSGIGETTCRRLLEAGHEVINLARRPARLVAQRLRSFEVDLTDASATRELAETIAREYPVKNFVHCAGAIREKPLEEVQLEDLTALANLHLAAAVSVAQANLATMKAARYGRIVLVSTRAVLGLARRTAYSATKAGMLGLARTWALELAPHGITVNVVAPGPIAQTEMFHEVVPIGSPKLQAVTQAVPVGRLGLPEDVARAIEFFLAPEAAFVTGQTLYVCGGTSLGALTL